MSEDKHLKQFFPPSDLEGHIDMVLLVYDECLNVQAQAAKDVDQLYRQGLESRDITIEGLNPEGLQEKFLWAHRLHPEYLAYTQHRQTDPNEVWQGLAFALEAFRKKLSEDPSAIMATKDAKADALFNCLIRSAIEYYSDNVEKIVEDVFKLAPALASLKRMHVVIQDAGFDVETKYEILTMMFRFNPKVRAELGGDPEPKGPTPNHLPEGS